LREADAGQQDRVGAVLCHILPAGIEVCIGEGKFMYISASCPARSNTPVLENSGRLR
jgi:hypothetical protein